MLLRDNKQAEDLAGHQVCGYCTLALTYPIVIVDRNHTAYHAACALGFATDIMADLGDLVQPLQAPIPGSMEEAFRIAVRDRRREM